MIHSAIDRAQLNSTPFSEYSSIAARGPMLDRVYSLRYKSYSNGGYIDACTSHKFMDEFDAQANCTSYLMYHGRQLMGSIRACVYRPGEDLSIPVMDVFPNEIAQFVNLSAPVVEANKFVIDPTLQARGGASARFHLFRNIIEAALDENAKTILAAVRTEHIKFYGTLAFNQISGAKVYPHLSFETVLLQCTDIEAFRKRVWRKTEPRPERRRAAGNDTVLNYSTH